jgi:uncharacterized protein
VTRSAEQILRESRTVAVVGASPRPGRPSHDVIDYLLGAGYTVIPVNPTCEEVLGLPCVPSLASIHEPVDLVDVFRRTEHVVEVAREAAAIGAGALWLQLGLVSPEARRIALESGMDYVEDECTAIVHSRLVS